MFGGHVSAQDGKSDLEHPSVITPIVHLMEISMDGSDSVGLVSRFAALLQEAYAHTQIYVCMYVYIFVSSSLDLLLKFIYVTGWLDPKSCVHIFINKIFNL